MLCAKIGLAPSLHVCGMMADKTNGVRVPIVLSVTPPGAKCVEDADIADIAKVKGLKRHNIDWINKL